MTGSQYQKLCARTECDQWRARLRYMQADAGLDLMAPIRINHGLIGLIGEVGEIVEVCEVLRKGETPDWLHLKEELGDACWYLALICNACNFDLASCALGQMVRCDYTNGSQLGRLDEAVCFITKETGNLAGYVERWLHYGKDLDLGSVYKTVARLFAYIDAICFLAGCTLHLIWESNIAKLKQRYPDKYSDFLADEVNRNREAERLAIKEGNTLLPELNSGTIGGSPEENLTTEYLNDRTEENKPSVVQDGHGFGHVEHDLGGEG